MVTWEGWQAIDAIETAAGEDSAPARPRVKLTEWAALREAAARTPVSPNLNSPRKERYA